ncbi:MAG: hypothetical protein R2856_01145 [Caldilineaceae bacterium]
MGAGGDVGLLPGVVAAGRNAVNNPTETPAEAPSRWWRQVADMALHLANYPDWTGNAWAENDEETIFGVDFYSEAADEWLGNGRVDLAQNVVLEYYAPRDLTPEEFQAGLARVKPFLDDDPEVQARLAPNPDFWYEGIYYNRWDGVWEAYYERGLEAFVVAIYLDGDNIYVDSIYDPYGFDEAEALEDQRNRAISLAWEAPGIDVAIEGVDNWATYAEKQSDALWTVEFAAQDRSLFAALVNIETWEVIEVGR